jgi:hypothetical protein
MANARPAGGNSQALRRFGRCDRRTRLAALGELERDVTAQWFVGRQDHHEVDPLAGPGVPPFAESDGETSAWAGVDARVALPVA